MCMWSFAFINCNRQIMPPGNGKRGSHFLLCVIILFYLCFDVLLQCECKLAALDSAGVCGFRFIENINRGRSKRVVGGSEARRSEWPWMALVLEVSWLGRVKYKCGGTLITRRHILTAAHCRPRNLSTLEVHLGMTNLSSKNEPSNETIVPLFEAISRESSDADREILVNRNVSAVLVTRTVSHMIAHVEFNDATFENDIAVLVLDKPVDFNLAVIPACLPKPSRAGKSFEEDLTSKVGVVTGWGRTSHGGKMASVLQFVALPILENGECQRMFLVSGQTKVVRDNFLCAGYPQGQKDACEGDSGGPLVIEDKKGRWTIAGIVSHGFKCAEPNLPGIYIRVSRYLNWIHRVIDTEYD